jgi:CubicO group peptidase (beta-lactamase class C family)
MTIVNDGRRASSPGTGTTEGRNTLTLPDLDLDAAVRGILHRRPAVGFALAVIRHRRPVSLRVHGLADIATRAPIAEDTVFRIASVTKLFTAIAVMQLWEERRIDLDAPASEYLRAFELVPARPTFRPVTIRHLLTHTAGIPDVVHPADLLHPGWGPFDARPAEASVPAGSPMPSLAEYYRGGLRVTVEPGTTFQYTNHGFAALGRIVEDVTGVTLARHLRERVFEPLGMVDTDLVRSERLTGRLATGYSFGRAGATPVPDRDWICAGAGGAYSTVRDLALFTEAVLGGGANGSGRVLEPETFATMCEPHYRPDPRLAGRGLGFFRAEVAGWSVVGHDGILPGFDARLLAVPDAGIGVVALTNGSSGAHGWLEVELDRVLRRLLDAPDDAPSDAPHHPELWPELCGRYGLPAGSDLRGRIALGAGVEVFVRGGRLMVRILTPMPALLRGLPLEPTDPTDPRVLRLDLTSLGMPSVRIVFGRDAGGVVVAHLDLAGQPLTLRRVGGPTGAVPATRMAALGALAAVATVATITRRRRVRASREVSR